MLALAVLGVLSSTAMATTPYDQGAFIYDSTDDFWVYSNGAGQFNTEAYVNNQTAYNYSGFYYAPGTGVSITDGAADNGLNIAVYNADGQGTTKVYGFEGTPFTPTNPTAPVALSSSGTTQTLVSHYTTGDCTQVYACLQVTETDSYTTGQQSVVVGYDIQNVSKESSPGVHPAVNFRVISGGDVKPGGDEGGTGYYSASGTPVVGTVNAHEGAGMELQQSNGALAGGTASPNWTAYEENTPFEIWNQVKTPDTGSLTNTTLSTYADKAAAVQWDTFKSTTLPWNNNTGSAYFETRWHFYGWTPLTSPSNSATIYAPTQSPVSFDFIGHDPPDGSTLTDFSAHQLYWRVSPYSSNPSTNFTAATTPNGIGHATVSYTGANEGQDEVDAFEDLNGNQTRDPFEPQSTAWVTWFNQLDLVSFSPSQPYEGASETATVKIWNANHTPATSKAFDYKVVDKADPTRVLKSGTNVTTSGVDGSYPITWTRPDHGTDLIELCTNFSATGAYNDCQDPGEQQTYSLDWLPRLEVYPDATTEPVNTTVNYTIYANNTNSTRMANTVVHYWIDNDTTDHTTAATGDGTTGTLGRTTASYTGTTVGKHLVHFYLDLDNSGSWNGTEPRFDAVVDYTAATYDNRLQADELQDDGTGNFVNNIYGTVGGDARTVNFTLYDDDGATLLPNVTIHYRISSSVSSCSDNSDHTVVTGTGGSAGKASIQLSCDQPGYQYADAWADTNGNGVQDGNEPSSYGDGYITWVNAFDFTGYQDTVINVPGTAYATVAFRDPQGRLIKPQQYSWKTVGLHNTDYQASPLTTTSGSAAISWPTTAETNTGNDILYVKANIGGVDQVIQKTFHFISDVTPSPIEQTQDVGDTAYISPYLYTGSNTGAVFHWTVSGANADSTDRSVTYPNDISYVGHTPGDDTIHIWYDANGNGIKDSGEPETDAYVHWRGSLALANTSDGIVGTTKTVTATLYDPNTGLPVGAGSSIRWSISGSNNPGGKESALTDANGQVQIQWQATYRGCDDLYVYADTNNNATQDTGEPQVWATICFHDRLEDDTYGYDSKMENSTETITMTYRDQNFAPIANYAGLKWMIVGSGSDPAANPHSTPQPLTTDANGQAVISWTGTEAGVDVLKVWDDANNNNVLDSGELSSTTTVNWQSRVQFDQYSPYTRDVTSGPLDVTARLYKTDGSSLGNTTLTYKVDGINATNGNQTVTTGPNGSATIHMASADAGQDTLTAWLDSNNNGVRDAGEPEQILVLNWHAAVAVSPSYIQRYQTQTLTSSIVVTASPAPANQAANNLHVTLSGANYPTDDQRTYSYTNTPISITPDPVGGRPGRDYVDVWLDANGNGVRDLGETATTIIDWDPLVVIGQPTGTLVAGTATSVPAQLIDTTGTGTQATHLKFKVTGANSVAPTAVTTDANGNASGIGYTGTNNGTDTITIWEDVNNDGVVDAGEPQDSRVIGWAAPPVVLGISPSSDSKLQGNSESATVTLSGMPGGNAGKTVYWSVSGVNSGSSGSATTDGSGNATVGPWTGTLDGTDHLNVYADVSGASAVQDGYDPSATLFMTWNPLVQLSSTTTTEALGATHTETIHFVHPDGSPLTDTQVIYQISGANPTSGQIVARPIGSGVGSQIQARTDSSGNASVSWVGTNAGTDTLNVWADTNGNGVVDAAEPHASKSVTFGNVPATTSSTGTGSTATTGSTGTTGSTSAVTPGSANDFDGLPAPPPPVVAKAVNVAPVSGKVLVKLPGKNKYIELLDGEQIPVGSIVDTTKGVVALTSAQNLKGGVATANFYKGVFQIAQKKAAKPVTDLVLYGGNFGPCGKIAKKAATTAQKKLVRQLWGKGHGLFRTKGKYAAASIRGTTYQVADYCDGTLVKVTDGAVSVQDFVHNTTKSLKAPKTLFVPAKK